MQKKRRAAGHALACALALGGCYDGVRGASEEVDSESSATTDEDTGSTGDADPGDPIPDDIDPKHVLEPLVTRLNDTQYRYTVLDVLGVELDEQERGWLPRDVPIDGHYSTSAEGQVFSPQYVLGYAYIARSIAERVDTLALLDAFGDCGDVSPACIGAFAEGLGLRLYRRPLDAQEIAIYTELADAIARGPGTEDADVVAGVLQALLQAPQFLYRVEQETDGTPGDLRRLDGYELASRLSYFLWQSAPDTELLEFAAAPFDAGALEDQISRMTADPKFARTREVFWGDYSLASLSSFATTDAALATEYRRSLIATFDRISGAEGDPQPLSTLFDGHELVMSGPVAEIAGVTPKGDGLEVYAELDQRTGVVTHPSFIAAIGTTSFVGRGVFMTERLLCQHTASPPGDANTAERIMDTAQQTSEMTPREASEFRFGLEPVCLTCHTQFEPIAYAFERYDISGAFVLEDEQGRELYSDGALPMAGDRPEIAFADAGELLTALADEASVQACLVENMMEYGTGHPATGSRPFVEHAYDDYAARGRTFDALVRAVAASDLLSVMRIVEP